MGVLDSFGVLASALIAAIVMLVFAVISFYITVFVVDVGAGLAGLSPDADFIVLSAAVLVAGAIVAGGSPLTAIGGAGSEPDSER